MNIPDLTVQKHRSEAYIKKHYDEFYQHLYNTYDHCKFFIEKLYWYHHSLTEYPKCLACGKVTTFKNFIYGYHKFCSRRCASQYSVDKIKQTTLERYGKVNYRNTEKRKQTCLEKYGKEYYVNTEKRRRTCLKKYGVDNYIETDEFKERVKKTCLEKYGKEHYNNPEKRKRTCLKKYGVDNYLKSNDYLEKRKQTCLERYGVDNYTKTDEFKKKLIQSCLEKYDTEYYNNPEKRKQTCLDKYGVEYYTQSKDFKDKTILTCLEKYGKEHYTQSEDFLKKEHDTKTINNSFNKSTIEEQFKQYLEDHHINFRYQYYSEPYPFNCDFYFPDKNIYLEINGSWTHGGHPYNEIDDKDKLELWIERSKTSDYYKNTIENWTIRDPKKVQVAKENGVNLKVFYGYELENLLKFCKDNNII